MCLQVADLKKELATLGLPTKGLKPELLQRLEQHLQEQGSVTTAKDDCETVGMYTVRIR